MKTRVGKTLRVFVVLLMLPWSAAVAKDCMALGDKDSAKIVAASFYYSILEKCKNVSFTKEQVDQTVAQLKCKGMNGDQIKKMIAHASETMNNSFNMGGNEELTNMICQSWLDEAQKSLKLMGE